MFLFLICLANANKEKTVDFKIGRAVFGVGYGYLMTTPQMLSKRTGFSEITIRRKLKKLEDLGLIEKIKKKYGIGIKINNFSKLKKMRKRLL